MLILLKIEIPQRLLRAPRNLLGAGELRHEQPATAQPSNHTSEKGVRNTGHRREYRRRPDRQVANFERCRNHELSVPQPEKQTKDATQNQRASEEPSGLRNSD